ncbi:Pentatricopeptide repeat-containing protein [Chlorella vulgaris]
MLAACRQARVLRLRQAVIAAQALQFYATKSDDGRAKQQDAPLVFSRQGEDQGSLRYYELPSTTSTALDMLQSSILKEPIASPGAPRIPKLPPPSVCASVLTKAVEQDASLAGKAAELAELLLQSGVPLDAHTVKALFAAMAKADLLGGSLPVLDAWLQQQQEALAEDAATQAPLHVMTQLMDAAARSDDTHLLLQVLMRMARIGVTPQPQSLTTLLQCFMRLGQVTVAHDVLDWMRRNNLGLNVYSYTALLALTRGTDEAAATTLLQQARLAYDKMREDGVQPNARFFTQYVRICGRAARSQAARAAWQDAKQAGVQPDLILYSAMIDCCAKCKDSAAAMEVFEEMRARRVQPDVVAYTSMLTALQGTPQAAASARKLWRSMAEEGVQANGMAVAAYLELLLAEGEIDEALQALAVAQPGAGDPPSSSRGGKTSWQRKTAGFVLAAGLEEPSGAGAAAGAAAPPPALSSAVDLPRLYEHFMFAAAHKRQFGVVEQLARHQRSRGLSQTLGTASALLTAQALQHGHATAKWLLQPPGIGSGGSGGGGGTDSGRSAVTVRLPDEVVESCLLGRGTPQACMHQLMASSTLSGVHDSSGGGRGGHGGRSSSGGQVIVGAGFSAGRAVANIVLAGLAARGCTADAVQLYDWMKQQQRQQQSPRQQAAAGGAHQGRQRQRQPSVCSPNAWTRQLLLFTALNAAPDQQLELLLRALKEARGAAASGSSSHGHGTQPGSGGKGHAEAGWDRRTRAAILAAMRQSGEAQQLLGMDLSAEEAEERQEQLQQAIQFTMIVYRKALLGLHLLFRLYGSAILRTAVWGVIAAIQTTLLYFLPDNYLNQYFANGRIMIYTLFVSLMSLLVIFRQNASYGRWHEGRTKLQLMTSAWLDSCVKCLSFDGGDKVFGQPDAASMRFKLDCVHFLMHGVALQFLRSDWMLANLAEHDESKLPPWDAANSPTFSPAVMDYFVLRSVSHRRLAYNAAHPIPVVGLLTEQEVYHLCGNKPERVRSLSNDDWDNAKQRPSIFRMAQHHMFANSQGKYVRGAAERLYTLYFLVHERFRQRLTEGGLDMPAPILSNMYTSLQKGMDGFEQYLCDTPFPFAWAQLIMVMLLFLQFTAPFAVVSAVSDKALGIIFAAFSVQAYWALNEVSRELEDPFCFPPNDIPLARLQYQFNERILAAACTELPGRSADPQYRLSVQEALHSAAMGSLGAPDGAITADEPARSVQHDECPV